MTKNEANKQLNLGYLFLLTGILLGVLIHQKMNERIISSSFTWGYLLWSYYWGYKIIKSSFTTQSHPPVTIKTKSVYSYFIMSIRLLLFSVFFKFIFSIIIGILGGSIFKQIQLSKIAYF